MLPVSTVEKDSFRALVSGLSSGGKLPCRKTIMDRMMLRKSQMTANLNAELGKVDYVCTTADIWSSNNKSYLGMTGHFIDDNLERQSVVLSCKRMKFSHTYQEIGKMLVSIHRNYNLHEGKVVGTVTDNASNFAKSFRIYTLPENVLSSELDFLNDENQTISLQDFPQFHKLESAIEDQEDEITLPEHYRCCSHTLNLIATKDIEQALSDMQYKKIYYSSFGKLTSLWNLCHRSTNISDQIEAICNCKLIVPCPTRWNSLFDSVKRILAIHEFLPAIFETVGKPKLKTNEMEFLMEYVSVMEGLAKAIDILQGEDNCFLGYVLPSLIQITQSLQSLTHLTYCNPLKDAINNGIKKRFDNIINLNQSSSKKYILATTSLPKFKLKWLTAAGVSNNESEIIKGLFLMEMEKIYKTYNMTATDLSEESQEDEDEFFSILTSPNSTVENKDKESTTATTSTSIIQMEFIQYLQDKSKDISCLFKYKTILHLFKR